MAMILIDTDGPRCWVNGVEVFKSEVSATNKLKTIADWMEQSVGAKEWDATVQQIQKWFYGSLVKDAWCCTGLSYFAAMAGVGDQTGRYENVDSMKDFMNSRGMLDCTGNYGGGHYVAQRGDVVFMSSKHSYADCTHVGVISSIDHSTGDVVVCSCNCDDQIKQKTYNYKTGKYIVAWGRVDY